MLKGNRLLLCYWRDWFLSPASHSSLQDGWMEDESLDDLDDDLFGMRKRLVWDGRLTPAGSVLKTSRRYLLSYRSLLIIPPNPCDMICSRPTKYIARSILVHISEPGCHIGPHANAMFYISLSLQIWHWPAVNFFYRFHQPQLCGNQCKQLMYQITCRFSNANFYS